LLPPFLLEAETDPVSETLCSLEYRKMVKVKKSVMPKTREENGRTDKKYGRKE
jgi:hypothetical protein